MVCKCNEWNIIKIKGNKYKCCSCSKTFVKRGKSFIDVGQWFPYQIDMALGIIFKNKIK